MDWRHRVAFIVLCVQLLLVLHTYRSTDFEVHRNWLAITYSLPIQQWYTEATSEWTLDYPPLFAWFEWALAHVAALFDPHMLQIKNLEYASDATVLFQRLSVCATSLVLVAAMLRATSTSRDSPAGLTLFVLVVANAGLIMVDNIHFQYNSILMGILLHSILLLEEQRYVLGGVLFAVLLNMKHLFAYLAPVFFVLLLKHYVLTGNGEQPSSSSSSSSGGSSGSWAAAAGRLVLLGGAVLAVCGASFGPFVAMGQLKQVMSRLFPFARGLCHAYWAPNAWALYSFLDKVAAAAAAKAGLIAPPTSANMAGGVVGISSYLVLPNVGAGTTAALVLLAMLPCLLAIWKAPRHKVLALLAPAVAYASLCGFMWGYHVHEKAALTVEIPLALAAVRHADWGQHYILLSTAAHVGIFPLLFQTQEVPIRWLLAVVFYIASVWGLASIHTQQQQQGRPVGRTKATKGQAAAAATPAKQQQQHNGAAGSSGSPATAASPSPVGVRTRRQVAQRQQRHQQEQDQQPALAAAGPKPVDAAAAGPAGLLSMHECCSWLPLQHRLYLAGLVLLELYCTCGHKVLFVEQLPFVPLMLTSVYCAVGFTWVWGWMAAWFVEQCR